MQRFAAGLEALGITRGDRVAMLLEMGVEAVVSFLAISHIGAIATPLFSGYGREAITSRLSASGACAFITDDRVPSARALGRGCVHGAGGAGCVARFTSRHHQAWRVRRSAGFDRLA